MTSTFVTITVFQKMNLNVLHAENILRAKERVKRIIHHFQLVRRAGNFCENIQSF
jgi:hypothetical protein